MKKSNCIQEDIKMFNVSGDAKTDVYNMESSVNALFDLICKIKNYPIAIQNKIFSVMAEQTIHALSLMLDILESIAS